MTGLNGTSVTLVAPPVLVIRGEPNGALPGRLSCVCGAHELAVWSPNGARCDRCKRRFLYQSTFTPPEKGEHVRVRLVEDLRNWS